MKKLCKTTMILAAIMMTFAVSLFTGCAKDAPAGEKKDVYEITSFTRDNTYNYYKDEEGTNFDSSKEYLDIYKKLSENKMSYREVQYNDAELIFVREIAITKNGDNYTRELIEYFDQNFSSMDEMKEEDIEAAMDYGMADMSIEEYYADWKKELYSDVLLNFTIENDTTISGVYIYGIDTSLAVTGTYSIDENTNNITVDFTDNLGLPVSWELEYDSDKNNWSTVTAERDLDIVKSGKTKWVIQHYKHSATYAKK